MFFIFSFLIMGSIYGYVEWRFISLLTLPFSIKILLSILLLPAIFNLWIILFYGDVIPTWLSKALSGTQVLLIYLFTLTFILDMFRLVVSVHPQIPNVALVLSIILSFYSVFNASLSPKIKNVVLETHYFSKNEKPLNIVQLSDFHIGQGFDGKWLDDVIEKTNSLSPDLIVITGDLIDKSPDEIGKEMEKLTKLKSKLGTYIVFGNHEYYHHATKWKEFFKNLNIPILFNEHTSFLHNGKEITLAGIDFGARYIENNANQLLQKTFENSNNDSLKILLAHHPHVFKKIDSYNVFLQLSGHTHGGMIFPVDIIVKLSNKGFLRGLYKNKNSNLYVSNGTGLWGGFPARFGTFNEISNIIIKGK